MPREVLLNLRDGLGGSHFPRVARKCYAVKVQNLSAFLALAPILAATAGALTGTPAGALAGLLAAFLATRR